MNIYLEGTLKKASELACWSVTGFPFVRIEHRWI